MCTSEGALVLRPAGYDDPQVQLLVEAVQQEYVVRYGGRDAMEVDPGEVLPPRGLLLLAELDGRAVGCGAWRVHDAGTVEVKRMYVAPAARRRGVADRVLAALEQSARTAGHRRVVLNTGDRQPEALALYARAGYTPVAGYGVYADAPGAVFLGKSLELDREGGA
ncbi:N-acetylglutamate synthase, GNAT family [Klenkia marina]|uniref:N-acetylglutamate synthase, GNAT family n=1 Tax=Klenkia marina TaxID=1960309 RepID=A0A1G4YHI9_9ACTN|nr:GNAT family N-acetyltransferase [Klenkia marina]SCX52970.1 N-acetylglutamate synthase, GNAT family [Klenkia marina]